MRFEAADILQEYHKEIDKYSILSKEDELELARRIQASTGPGVEEMIRGRKVMVYPEPTDTEAVNMLVQANLKFVVTMANKFIGNNVPIADLISAGNVGIILAARKFSPDKGVRFITFAVWYLQKYINNELEETSRIVRIPKNQSLDIYLKRKAGEEVVTRDTVSIDKPVSEDSDNTLGDMLLRTQPEIMEQFDTEEREKTVHVMMSVLNEQEQNIIKLRFGFTGEEDMSNKEIASKLDIPEAVVGRAIRNAYKKMRDLKLERV